MGADPRKRRLSSGDFGHGLRERRRAKKNNVVSQQYNLNPHISLRWDDNEKRVVAKGDQIGLPWRHLNSVIAALPHQKSTLADVITIPADVFDLNNLKELVSYEAWRSLLSDQERNYLKQFLPGETDPEQVVKQLLAGENFHFGNPFMKWGVSLCSGDLHPDAVLQQEQSVRVNKKAYYSELQNYHDNMIGCLLNMKERCANSSDPEAVIMQIMRSRGVAGTNQRKSHDHEENVAATSESASWIADEKACSSDNLNLLETKGPELQKRFDSKDLGKTEKSAGSPEGLIAASNSRKGEKQQKLNTNYDDGAKYMSYVKISKKQHELVKSLKQSGNSIQSRALNHVLGNLDNFHVKPYEMFEKEEQNRILEYWSNLANTEIPAASENWKKRQAQKLQILTSLCQEMEGKPNNLIEDENGTPSEISQDHQGDAGAADQSTLDDNSESYESSLEDQSLPIPSVNVNLEFSPVDLNAEDNAIALRTSGCNDTSEDGEGSQNVLDYPENPRHVEIKNEQQLCQFATLDAWCPASIHKPFSGPASSGVEYTPSSNLSLRHQVAIEQQPPAGLVDLESEIPAEDPTRDFLHQRSTEMPYFNYRNRDRNDLLPSFLKREGYPRDQRTTGMDFNPTTTSTLEPGHFPAHFREQVQRPFAFGPPSEKLGNAVFMHQNIQEMYPHNNRFALPKQENFPPMSMEEWGNNGRVVVAPAHSHLGSGEMLNHSWFHPSDNRIQGSSWSAAPDSHVFSNPQVLGSGSSGDQSLYSVLSQCNDLRSRPPFDVMGSMIPTMSYGEGMSAAGNIPRTVNHHLPPPGSSPFEYLSGQQDPAGPAAALKTSTMGWMLPPRQTTTSLHDPTEKSFLKSWNQ
ncbi:hypothetical protein Dimus_013021 [Dionaea muscipula]